MNGKLIRAELNSRLELLAARAREIMKQEAQADRLEAIAGEAEPLESLVSVEDQAYFSDQVERILQVVGAIPMKDDSGER